MFISRRSVLQGSALGALLASLPLGVRLSFAQSATPSPVIIFLLLRGGMDGLYLVSPSDDADLIAARPANLRLAASGTGAGLALANGPSKNDWRLHPSAPEMKALYDAGHLAFVHASGLPADSRSHFEMQALLEHGITDPTLLAQTYGWIGRYATSTGIAASTFGLVSAAPTLPASMSGDPQAISLPSPSQFTLGSTPRAQFLQSAYGPAPGLVGSQGRVAINAVQTYRKLHGTAPAAGSYANNPLAQAFSVIAELIKLGVGLQVAEVEYSNWDTHINENPRFAASAAILSRGLGDFYNDIAASGISATVVAMSEFGRRVQSNANGGTDHGHGNVMMVLGPAVRGGRIYGTWPGLSPAVLNLGDVPVTTDARAVLSEVITATRGDLPAGLFPGLAAAPSLGLFAAPGATS